MSQTNKFCLVTNLNIAACVERLREVTADGLLASGGDHPVAGWINEGGFRLRKQIRQKNSFQLNVWGSFTDTPGGTRIDCRVGMHPFVKIFMTIWCGFVVLMGALILFSDIPFRMNGELVEDNRIALLCLVPFLAFGIGLTWFGRYAARHEPVFICDLLCQTLDAKIESDTLGHSRQPKRPATQQSQRARTIER